VASKRKTKSALVRQLEASIKLAKKGKLREAQFRQNTLGETLREIDGVDRPTTLDDPGDRKRKNK
jgi:hypothetical protein